MRRSRVMLLGAMLKVSSEPQTVCAAACQARSRPEEAAGPLFTVTDQARACIENDQFCIIRAQWIETQVF